MTSICDALKKVRSWADRLHVGDTLWYTMGHYSQWKKHNKQGALAHVYEIDHCTAFWPSSVRGVTPSSLLEYVEMSTWHMYVGLLNVGMYGASCDRHTHRCASFWASL